MNYLYFSPFATDCINASVLLNSAFEIVNNEQNSIVHFIYFDYPGVSISDFNNERSKVRNIEYAFDNHVLLSKFKHDRIKTIPFSSIHKEATSVDFTFSSLSEVKEIEYKGVNIGFGVVSNFVSFTRNINPYMSEEVRRFILQYLKSCSEIVETLDAFIQKNNIKCIKTHNGRFATLRPVIELAKKYTINYSITEMLPFVDPSDMKYHEYVDAMPHSINYRTHLIHSLWNDIDEENPIIYADFYEKRAKGVRAGDKVYTGLQNPNELPKDWDENKKNYVYFTSSEDEFFSIGREWDELRLFPNQEIAAESVAKICMLDPSIHLYIRIHPNLIGLNYSYAKFENLKCYRNVTIIPAESSISSYKLLFACDKCLTMGSTIGIEATYWDKPSVLLNASWYYYLDVAYIPKSLDQLKDILLNVDLSPKSKKGCYMYAKSIMYDGYGKTPKYVNYNMTPIYFRGRRLEISQSMTILGSRKLYKVSVIIFRLLYILDKYKYKKNIFPKLLIEAK